MRLSALIAISLLSLPVHAAKVTPFNQHCLESESIMVSVQGQPAPVIVGEACQYGQLTLDDLSYVESVQPAGAVRKIAERPAQAKPAKEIVEISGEVCHYGQLTAEDLSYVESVQPANAVRRVSAAK